MLQILQNHAKYQAMTGLEKTYSGGAWFCSEGYGFGAALLAWME